MKSELEHIHLLKSNQSFHYFKSEVDAFKPYWHHHPELELTLITKGKGMRFVGDSIAPFLDFDLVFVGKNVPHHWVSIETEQHQKQQAIVFQFKEDLFSKFKECESFFMFFELAKRGIQFESPSEDVIKSITEFQYLSAIQQLAALLELMEALMLHKNKQLLTSESYTLPYDRKISEEKFSKVNHYILEHLNQRLTLNQMADVVHMVPQSFCRWFKKHSGYSFIAFVNKSRIEYACQLLTTSDLQIQDIAFGSGFESLSQFNRTFKTLKGCSPREFRQMIHEPR